MNAGTLVLLRRRLGEGIQVLTHVPLVKPSLRAPGGKWNWFFTWQRSSADVS